MNPIVFMMMAGAFAAPAPDVQSFNTVVIPAAQTAIEKSCAVKPGILVDWQNFGDDKDGQATFVKGGLGFLTDALDFICTKDKDLKAELKKQVKSIVLSQAYGAADPIIYIDKQRLHIEYLWAKGEPGPEAMTVKDGIAGALMGEGPNED